MVLELFLFLFSIDNDISQLLKKKDGSKEPYQSAKVVDEIVCTVNKMKKSKKIKLDRK